jgi:hypothetical protein
VADFGSKGDSKTDWRQRGLGKPVKALLECRGEDDNSKMNICSWQDNISASCITIYMHMNVT